MSNILVALIHPDEWNQYIPFNGYISSIKHNYDYVVGVVPEYPLILLSEADEYYTIKNENMPGLGYPSVLDTQSRTNDTFINLCVEQVKKDFCNDKLTIISWQPTKYHNGVLYKSMINTDVYRTSFRYAQQWYKTGKLIYPTKTTYDSIKSRYEFINEQSIIVLSRNFTSKALIHNTNSMIPNFVDFLEYLSSNGLNIINIGFPPISCKTNKFYHEINDKLTQDELVSMFYLAKGVMLQGDSNGFLAHYASNVDMFVMTSQWSVPGEDAAFDVMSYKTNTVLTRSLVGLLKTIHSPNQPDKFDEILSILTAHQPTREIKFSDTKKITYI